MRQLNEGYVAAAPLSEGPVAEAWRSYLALWRQGNRANARTAVDRFVDLPMESGPGTSATFAHWLCSVLFDQSDFWSGQWGGGLTPRKGRWERPVEPALTVHPLTVRVTLPYLISDLSGGDGRHLRWAYQFTVGQSYRLPPRELRRWRQALDARCGPGAPPIELLRCAADDVLARRMLRAAEG